MENNGILWNNLTKPPVARKLAVIHTSFVCLTASFLATGGFKSYFLNGLQACLFKYITVAAIRIYAQRGEDAARLKAMH